MAANGTIYLDNAATTFPKPEVVYQKMEEFLRTLGANPGRSGHGMAVGAETEIEKARNQLAKLFNISKQERIVFTLNCTDALNIGIKGLLERGDHVITSVLEHNSVSRPIQRFLDDEQITLTRITASPEGIIDPEDVRKALTPETKLVAITHGSNVLGAVQPIREIGAIVKETDAHFLVDAAQTSGVVPIDVEADHIDLLAFAGHKGLYGPPGSGALYVSDSVNLEPWREGGTGGDSSSPLQPEEFPFYLEGGTPNTVGIVGLGAGATFIMETGMDKIHQHELKLRGMLIDAFRDDDRFTLYGPLDDRAVSPLSLSLQDQAPGEIAGILDQSFSIAVRSGLHCAPYCHQHLGTHPDGTIRFSPGFFNTEEEIQTSIAALQEIAAAVLA